jgi:uncharacterized cupredoxin-like copper-binding protein
MTIPSIRSIAAPAAIAFAALKTSAFVRPGKTVKLVVVFHRKGTFRYICTVPGHAAAGANGIFTVR